METELRTPAREPPGNRDKTREGDPTEEIDGYEMLVGEGMESEGARNDFIAPVERLLEFESLERGQQHSRKNFDHAAEHSEMFKLVER